MGPSRHKPALPSNLSPAVAQPDASLSVAHPTPALRFDFGNRRLFGAVDGAGGLLALALAEGVRLVRRWQPRFMVDGAVVNWQTARAFGRRFKLGSTVAGLELKLATVVDPDTAALVQHWSLANTGSAPHALALRLDVEFDLQAPGEPAAAATLAVTPAGLVGWGAGGRLWLSADPIPNVIDSTRGQLEWRVAVAAGQSRTITCLLWAETAPPDDWGAAAERVLAAAREYEAWLRSCFDAPGPLLRSLYFVLDTILADAKDPGSAVVYHRVDGQKIGLMGHSLGGVASTQVARERVASGRNDIAAVINLDADLFGEYVGVVDGQEVLNQSRYPVPILTLPSEDMAQRIAAIPNADKLVAVQYISTTDPQAYEIVFPGTNHLSFTDMPLASPLLATLLNGSVHSTRGSGADPLVTIEKMNATVLQFFNAYLKDEGSFTAAE